jgi:hypothetical protein
MSASGLRQPAVHRLVEPESDSDAEQMDHTGRQYEADGIVSEIG